MKEQLEELRNKMVEEMNEPLHPDLLPYFEEEGALGPQLRHPLVYQVPFFTNGMANAYYKQKVKAIEDALAKKNYNTVVYLHERPYRIQAFLDVMESMEDADYWKLLSSIWTDTENSWQNFQMWNALLRSPRPERHNLMDEEELNHLASLPNEVVVYRGCVAGVNENGLSWTLDKTKAEFFANRFSKNGIVLEKTINKDEIVAVFLGRNESEVIF
jgi:hypothetical protein